MKELQATKLRWIIEQAKIDLKNRYDLNIAAMRGAFIAILYSKSVPSIKAQYEFDEQLVVIGSNAANTERQIALKIADEIFSAVKGASETSKMSDNLLAFQRDIVKQLSRDAKTFREIFRKSQLAIYGGDSDSDIK